MLSLAFWTVAIGGAGVIAVYAFWSGIDTLPGLIGGVAAIWLVAEVHEKRRRSRIKQGKDHLSTLQRRLNYLDRVETAINDLHRHVEH